MKPLTLRPDLKAIYDHLGEENLRKILIDFYQRMERDVMIGFFFTGKDVEAIALKQLSFLMRAMGATPSYSGKAPADAHGELPPIRRGMFDRRLRILEETLIDHNLSADDTRTWVAFENAFRDAVEHS